MYARYEKRTVTDGSTRYRFVEEVPLFGCNVGYIPKLLEERLSPDWTEPLKWHVNIASDLSAMTHDNQTLIIDLKPKNARTNLSLYEISNVWGSSYLSWTPIMQHLRGLFVDEDPNCFDRNDFVRRPEEIDEPIFSMMYLQGGVRNGQLEGKWIPPRPSSTNGVLLWPKDFEYFCQQRRNFY